MAKRYLFRRTSIKEKTLLSILFGVLLGLYIGIWSIPCIQDENTGEKQDVRLNYRNNINYGNVYSYHDNVKHRSDNSNVGQTVKNEKLLLIGVMTAKQYLNSRVVSSFNTWVQSIPGKVLYFSSEGSERIAPKGLPVIGLKGVDDTYPPQKKSFLMMKYMYEYYGGQFEWFMRADDDIYIKSDKIAMFLSSINSSYPHYIGQAGLGNKDEFGTLNLDKKENYCMGGPGMVFSKATLEKMVPQISFCLKNLYTTHEDVEVGRCVQKMAAVSCTWAYEMQHLFYHNHKQPNGSFTHFLKTKDTDRAITLHPVKNHIYQYRLHNHFQSMQSQELRHQMLLLQRQINQMDEYLQDRDAFYSPNRLGLQPTLLKYVPKSREEVISWEFIGKSLYSHRTVNPRPGITHPQKVALEDIIRQVMHLINHNARQRGRTIDFKEILYGYKRLDPLHGADYVLDLLLVYRKHKGRKMTIPVRRHAYLQQTFSEIEFREDICSENNSDATLPSLIATYDSTLQPTQKPSEIFGLLKHTFEQLFSHNDKNNKGINIVESNGKSAMVLKPVEEKVLHFIMPLSGRYETFLSFMVNFEQVALKSAKMIVLSVMLFEHESNDTSGYTAAYLNRLQEKYPRHKLQSVKLKGPFSRGLGLEQGSLLFGPDALLVFIDVDMYIHPESLSRIKWNTIQGKQVYFPVVFSQFDPTMYCNSSCLKRTHPFYYDEVTGYWRQFGFGIAAMYNSDFQKVGGFDKSIQGWGMEDVKLFETYVKRNFSLFRGVDPGLVHIFHPIHCDSSLETSQYQSCLGTKSQTFASVQILSQMVYKNRAILERNEVILQSQQYADGEVNGGNNGYLRVPNIKDENKNYYIPPGS